MAVRSHEVDNRAPVLERYILHTSHAAQSQQLAITIGSMPSEGLIGLSDVRFRQQSKTLYTSRTLSGLPPQGFGFVSTDKQELSAFIGQGGRYATIVLSGQTGSSAALEQDMADILASWRWL
ncbi:MAG TPA: hypothetical protein VF598_13200 [Hymenobacter sp.]